MKSPRLWNRTDLCAGTESGNGETKALFPWYSVTDAGEDIMRASGARRIRRKTATAALMEFMKRVQRVNASHDVFRPVAENTNRLEWFNERFGLLTGTNRKKGARKSRRALADSSASYRETAVEMALNPARHVPSLPQLNRLVDIYQQRKLATRLG